MKKIAKISILSVGAIALALSLSSCCGKIGRSHCRTDKPCKGENREDFKGPHDGHGKFNHPPFDRDKMFKETDKNSDGKISKTEFDASSSERFDRIDDNKDGFITKEEMMESFRKMKEDAPQKPKK